MPNNSDILNIEKLVSALSLDKSLDTALKLANAIMGIMLPNYKLPEIEDVKDSIIDVRGTANTKQEQWFAKHPYLPEHRIALYHVNDDGLKIESKFFKLGKDYKKHYISGSVQLTPNWEDSALTKYPQYKVGIDFFLMPNGDGLKIVLSNNGTLRLLELQGKLTNTQKQIITKLHGVGEFSGQDAIHKSLWETFGVKEVNKQFYRGIAEHFNQLLNHLVKNGKDKEEAKLFASRLLGRLLFVKFLDKKGIINPGMGYFVLDDPVDATGYYNLKLKKLFFETLNTPINDRDAYKKSQAQSELLHIAKEQQQTSLLPTDEKTPYLNGGLFDKHTSDWSDELIDFPKGYFKSLYAHFNEYNFTTDESSPDYEQVAIDPEMLGRVFENLLATQITETGKSATKAKGTYYTPRVIVSYMCKESLRQYLYTTLNDSTLNEGIDKLLDTTDADVAKSHTNFKRDLWGEQRTKLVLPKIKNALDEVKVLDPACGSGAFPMGMLQLLVKTYERLGEKDDYELKKQIIKDNLYGVDIEPMATEIARLRAWLSIVIDIPNDYLKTNPGLFALPNFNFKFITANSLIPLNKDNTLNFHEDDEIYRKLFKLKEAFYQIHDKEEKKKYEDEYDTITRNLGQSHSLKLQQIKEFRPFDERASSGFFDSEFMFGVTNGFNIIIGNPPYGAALTDSEKIYYKNIYKSAMTINGLQKGSLDTYTLFIERGYQEIQQNGHLSFIVPLTITSGDSMVGIQSLLLNNSSKINISSYCDRPVQIFKNAHKKLSIISSTKCNEPTNHIFMTKMYRLVDETNLGQLIDQLNFINVVDAPKLYGRLPKISEVIEKQILNKIFEFPSIDKLAIKNGEPVYYRSAGGMYFNVITDYSNGLSSEKQIIVKPEMVPVIATVLSSTLFWWYQQVYTDCFNLKAYEIGHFPIPSNNLDERTKEKIKSIWQKYKKDIEKNAEIQKTTASNTYTVSEFKVYKIRKSKPVIDELDSIVCNLYGLTQEETAFIKNYELEFRLNDE